MADALTFREYAECSGLCDQFGSPYDHKAYHTAMYSWEAAWKARPTPSPPVAAVPATPDRYEAIKEMAYLLKLAPRGEVVAVEALRVLGAHYDAALKAAGIAAAQPQPQPAQPLTGARSAAYYEIDRFLRNNLGDEDYAEYSKALDLVTTPSTPTPPEVAP